MIEIHFDCRTKKKRNLSFVFFSLFIKVFCLILVFYYSSSNVERLFYPQIVISNSDSILFIFHLIQQK